MAIFRDGVKVGNMDIRAGLSKKRAQGLLTKAGILDKKDTHVKSSGGVNLFAVQSHLLLSKGWNLASPEAVLAPKRSPNGGQERKKLGKKGTRL